MNNSRAPEISRKLLCLSLRCSLGCGNNQQKVYETSLLRCKRGPKKQESIYKKFIYSYVFKLQSPSKYCPFDAIHLSRCFFPLLKTVFELIDFDAF